MGLGRALFAVALGAIAACGARTGLPVPDSCPTTSAKTTRAALDVFFIVDSSGSMSFVTADGTTKWASARKALEAFLDAPDSTGIGAAITFFPQIDPSVPLLCATDAECGKGGACVLPKVCMPDPKSTLCGSDADCMGGAACKVLHGACTPSGGLLCATHADCTTAGDHCEPVGACSDGSALCFTAMPSCATGVCGGVGGCLNHTLCAESAYATPEKPVAILPGGAAGILSAFDGHNIGGATPTLPALGGTIADAKAWAMAHPTHKVVVVLVTDGLPTLCDDNLVGTVSSPAAVTHVAGVASAGAANGVDTYVIGVFTPAEQASATSSLNQIAMGGGTDHAYLIETSDVVFQKLIDAFAHVREQAARCTFAVAPEGGVSVDPTRATVALKRPDGSTVDLEHLPSAADCDGAGPSYFLDMSADVTGSGMKIGLCPATCDTYYAHPGTEIDLTFACGQ